MSIRSLVMHSALYLGILFLLVGCQFTAKWDPDPLAPSLGEASLVTTKWPRLLDEWERWYPKDPRFILIAGMLEEDSLKARQMLELAVKMRSDKSHVRSLAMAALSHAGFIDVTLAWKLGPNQPLDEALRCMLLSKSQQISEGHIPWARTLFLQPLTPAWLYQSPLQELEKDVLELLKESGWRNALGLFLAQELWAELEARTLEAYDSLDQILPMVFLEPLEMRPYDIRKRSKNAALGTILLGESLRKISLQGPSILWTGRTEMQMGLGLQAAGWQFLEWHARTYREPILMAHSMEAQGRIMELSEAWMHFLQSNRSLSLGERSILAWENQMANVSIKVNQAQETIWQTAALHRLMRD